MQALAGGGGKGDIYLLTPFLAVAVLLTALQHKQLSIPFLETAGQRYSQDIYIYHLMVSALFMEGLYALDAGPVYETLGSVIVFASTWALLYQFRKMKAWVFRFQKA